MVFSAIFFKFLSPRNPPIHPNFAVRFTIFERHLTSHNSRYFSDNSISLFALLPDDSRESRGFDCPLRKRGTVQNIVHTVAKGILSLIYFNCRPFSIEEKKSIPSSFSSSQTTLKSRKRLQKQKNSLISSKGRFNVLTAETFQAYSKDNKRRRRGEISLVKEE